MKLDYRRYAAIVGASLGLLSLPAAAQQPVPPPAPQAVRLIEAPSEPPAAVPAQQAAPALGVLADNVVAWDAGAKQVTLKAGETEAHFTFNLTNISSGEVTMTGVSASCGCTSAQLSSPLPLKLAPGATSQVVATLAVPAGMPARSSSVTVTTDKGNKTLILSAFAAQQQTSATPAAPASPAAPKAN